MPVLPIEYYSDYYLVEMEFQNFFNALGINYNLPSSKVYFIAEEFQITQKGNISPEVMIQGRPGEIIQSSETPHYQYTIKAPLIINNNQNVGTNFLPYNSLNYFALWLSNWQWQQLNAFNPLQTDLSLVNAVLSSYKISASAQQTTQNLEILSNTLLDSGSLIIKARTIREISLTDYNQYLDISRFFGRMVKNYDMYVNLQTIYNNGVTNSSPFLLTTGQSNGIFLDNSEIDIKFSVTPKFFHNTGNIVVFWLKNYSINQNFNIIGFEQNMPATNFAPGNFDYYIAENSMSIFNNLLIRFTAPFLISTKTQALNRNNLVSTRINFSMYAPAYSPGNSPYGGLNLFQSSIA